MWSQYQRGCRMQLSGGKGLGYEGAVLLADLLHHAPLLETLDLRFNPPFPHTPSYPLL